MGHDIPATPLSTSCVRLDPVTAAPDSVRATHCMIPETLLHPRYADLLARSELLAGFRPDQQGQIIGALAPRPHEYADGQIICVIGAEAECLWLVVRGRVDVREGANTIAWREPHEIIGEQAIIEDDKPTRSATLVACGQTELLAMTRDGIQHLCPELAGPLWRNLAKIVSRKLRQATVTRSSQTDRDRRNQALIDSFLNPHQAGLVRAQEGIDPERPQLGTERCLFIIAFTDIVGFSKQAHAAPDSETANMVRHCMEEQVAAFTNEGGLIDKFMGDGLMAYFRLPLEASAIEVKKACQKALNAALDARTRVSAITANGNSLTLRIGLHLGEALAGNFGAKQRMQVTLIGAEVNLAARLEQARVDIIKGGERCLGDIRVSKQFFERLEPEMKQLLPYRSLVEAKQTDILIQSGPIIKAQ